MSLPETNHVYGTCAHFDEMLWADKRKPCQFRKRAVKEGYCVVWKPRGTVESSTDAEGHPGSNPGRRLVEGLKINRNKGEVNGNR